MRGVWWELLGEISFFRQLFVRVEPVDFLFEDKRAIFFKREDKKDDENFIYSPYSYNDVLLEKGEISTTTVFPRSPILFA